MKRSTVPLYVTSAVLCSVLFAGAHAQPILKGKDLTERNLIEALTPAPDEVRTRSIRVERDQSLGKPSRSDVAKSAGASLLITFQTNSAQLTQQARSSLDVVGRALQAERLAEFSFAIEGHADPRGRHEYNLVLSKARADSVVEYLTTRHSIERERLKAIGKGDTEPMIPERPEAAENRRVTIVTQRE